MKENYSKSKLFTDMAFILLMGLIPFFWAGRGHIVTGSDNIYPLNPVTWWLDRLFVWNGRVNCGAPAAVNPSTLVFHGLQALFYFLGFSLEITQKLTFVFWFTSIALAMYYFVSAIQEDNPNRIQRLTAVFFYCFNPFVFNVWEAAKAGSIAVLLEMPLILGILVQVLNGKMRYIRGAVFLGLVTVVCSEAGVNPPLYSIPVIVFMVYFLAKLAASRFFNYNFKMTAKALFFLLFAGVVVLLLNMYWWLPYFHEILSRLTVAGKVDLSAFNMADWLKGISTYTSILNVSRLQGAWDWYYSFNSEPYIVYASTYFNNNIFILLSVVVPILAFSCVLFKKNFNVYVFSCLAFLSVIFGCGSHPPSGPAYLFLVKCAPVLKIFRSPYYLFGLITIFSYAYLGSLTVSELYKRARDAAAKKSAKYMKFMPVFILFLIISTQIIYNYPLVFGKIIYTHKNMASIKLKIPEYVFDFGNWINNVKDDKRVISLPRDSSDNYRWGYGSLAHIVTLISRKGILFDMGFEGAGFESPDTDVKRIFYSVLYSDVRWTYRILRLLNVGYILLRNDSWYDYYGDKDSPDIVKEKIVRQEKVDNIKKFGEWDVFAAGDSLPKIYGIRKTTLISEDVDILKDLCNYNSFENSTFIFVNQFLGTIKPLWIDLLPNSIVMLNGAFYGDFLRMVLGEKAHLLNVQCPFSDKPDEPIIGSNEPNLHIKKGGIYQIWTENCNFSSLKGDSVIVDGVNVEVKDGNIPLATKRFIGWRYIGEVNFNVGEHLVRLSTSRMILEKNIKVVFARKEEILEVNTELSRLLARCAILPQYLFTSSYRKKIIEGRFNVFSSTNDYKIFTKVALEKKPIRKYEFNEVIGENIDEWRGISSRGILIPASMWFNEKFYGIEKWNEDGNGLWRWMVNNGGIGIFNFNKHAVDLDIEMTITSFAKKRDISFSLNGMLVKAQNIPCAPPTDVVLEKVRLKPGINNLKIVSLQKEDKISSVMKNNEDNREVSIAVKNTINFKNVEKVEGGYIDEPQDHEYYTSNESLLVNGVFSSNHNYSLFGRTLEKAVNLEEDTFFEMNCKVPFAQALDLDVFFCLDTDGDGSIDSYVIYGVRIPEVNTHIDLNVYETAKKQIGAIGENTQIVGILLMPHMRFDFKWDNKKQYENTQFSLGRIKMYKKISAYLVPGFIRNYEVDKDHIVAEDALNTQSHIEKNALGVLCSLKRKNNELLGPNENGNVFIIGENNVLESKITIPLDNSKINITEFPIFSMICQARYPFMQNAVVEMGIDLNKDGKTDFYLYPGPVHEGTYNTGESFYYLDELMPNKYRKSRDLYLNELKIIFRAEGDYFSSDSNPIRQYFLLKNMAFWKVADGIEEILDNPILQNIQVFRIDKKTYGWSRDDMEDAGEKGGFIFKKDLGGISTGSHIVKELIASPFKIEQALLIDKKSFEFSNFMHSPLIEYHKINPTKYIVRIKGQTDAPFSLVFCENYDPHWNAYLAEAQETSGNGLFLSVKRGVDYLTGKPEKGILDKHFMANSYANAWVVPASKNIDKDRTIIIEYMPQRLFDLGIRISAMAFILCVILLIFSISRSSKN